MIEVGVGADELPSAAPGSVERIVVVVEGRDRIGGRTHTVDLGAVPVDLGGSWIHAGTESPMLPFVDALGVGR